MRKIKSGDIVQVIRGDDSGKKGKVLEIFSKKNCALVEGINLVKKHKRMTKQDEKGGIISVESAVNLSRLMLFCKHCNIPTRPIIVILKDGTKTRACRKCKEAI